MSERLRIVGKRVDHLERAMRKEERPLLVDDYARQKEDDKKSHEEAQKLAKEMAIAQQKAERELKERLGRMMPDYLTARAQVESELAKELEKQRQQAAKRIAQEKDKFRNKVMERRREERERREREAEEAAEREREEQGTSIFSMAPTTSTFACPKQQRSHRPIRHYTTYIYMTSRTDMQNAPKQKPRRPASANKPKQLPKPRSKRATPKLPPRPRNAAKSGKSRGARTTRLRASSASARKRRKRGGPRGSLVREHQDWAVWVRVQVGHIARLSLPGVQVGPIARLSLPVPRRPRPRAPTEQVRARGPRCPCLPVAAAGESVSRPNRLARVPRLHRLRLRLRLRPHL